METLAGVFDVCLTSQKRPFWPPCWSAARRRPPTPEAELNRTVNALRAQNTAYTRKIEELENQVFVLQAELDSRRAGRRRRPAAERGAAAAAGDQAEARSGDPGTRGGRASREPGRRGGGRIRRRRRRAALRQAPAAAAVGPGRQRGRQHHRDRGGAAARPGRRDRRAPGGRRRAGRRPERRQLRGGSLPVRPRAPALGRTRRGGQRVPRLRQALPQPRTTPTTPSTGWVSVTTTARSTRWRCGSSAGWSRSSRAATRFRTRC